MKPACSILVVSPDRGLSRQVTDHLPDCESTVSHDFFHGKEILDAERPDLLLTEVKLGVYNGLHLAIRADRLGIPAIVVGDADPVLEAEAERHRASYLVTPVTRAALVALIEKSLHRSRRTRRASRKHVPSLEGVAEEVPVHLVDVSYEGMRLETPAAETPLPDSFVVQLPQFQFSCLVRLVWSGQPADAAPGLRQYGAVIESTDPVAAQEWRGLVDALPGLAITA